jgi:hypothetical protein
MINKKNNNLDLIIQATKNNRLKIRSRLRIFI